MNANRIIVSALFLFGCIMGLNAQDANSIMQKVKDRPNGDTRSSVVELKLTNKRGSTRLRKLKSFSKDIGKDTKTIMFFTYPGDVKGTGFLTWNYDDPSKDDDKWLYLPAMKRTRRISSSSAKQDYFMGTDFTYDDMRGRNPNEDVNKLLGEETLNGQKCWVIESTPKDKREIYSKKKVWINQKTYLPIKAEYYDKLGNLQRVLNVSEVKNIDGFDTIVKEEMQNVQTGHKTEITMSEQTFNKPLDESMFTVVRLERGL